MDADQARTFLQSNHHVVLVTRRKDDRLQASPVVAGVNDAGDIVISVTEDRAKTKNVRRDPRVTLCCFTDAFFGPSGQVDGTAEIIPMPDALPELVALYRQVSGEHPDWADYERAMTEDRRCILRISVDH
jgi:PPOX class probable F420-dependent enzyme